MSFNIIHDNVGDLTKSPDWKSLKAKRIKVDEIILNGNNLPYISETGPNLTAYYNGIPGNVLDTGPIATWYQRLGDVVTYHIDEFSVDLSVIPANVFSITLAGFDFPPSLGVNYILPCSVNITGPALADFLKGQLLQTSELNLYPIGGVNFINTFNFTKCMISYPFF